MEGGEKTQTLPKGQPHVNPKQAFSKGPVHTLLEEGTLEKGVPSEGTGLHFEGNEINDDGGRWGINHS